MDLIAVFVLLDMIKLWCKWDFSFIIIFFFLSFYATLCSKSCNGNSEKVWNDGDRHGSRTSTSIRRIMGSIQYSINRKRSFY